MRKGKQPVILVDMDDVMAEFSETWLSRYNEDYNDNLTVEAFDAWDAQASVKPECGAKIFDYFSEPGIYRNLKPKPGSQEVLSELLTLGADIYIVTDSPRGCSYGEDGWQGSNPADDKRAWIEEHFPMLNLDNLVICRKKWMVNGDILIDDKPATIQKFMDEGRKILAMEMPYNRSMDVPLRAKTWADVREILLKEFYPEQVAV